MRQALKLQEAHFGLVYPEVASTLNVLGLVCGVLGRPDEAEFLHRRALGIARRTLGPGHPTVAASLRHLSKLYESQGKPDRLAKVASGRLPTSASPDIDAAGEAPAMAEDDRAAATRSLLDRFRASLRAHPSRFRQAAVLVVGTGVLLVSMLWFWVGRGGEEGDEVVAGSAVSAAAPEDEPVPTIDDADSGLDAEAVPGATDEPAPTPEPPVAPTGNASAVVTTGEVCSQLATRGDDGARLPEWRCDPVGTGAPTGLLFFYTRVRSRAGTTIEHRWYRDGGLDQTGGTRDCRQRRSGVSDVQRPDRVTTRR